MNAPIDLQVSVDALPTPGLIRPAIEAAVAGRAVPGGPDGPEATIAQAVAEAVRAAPAPTGGAGSC